VPGSHRERYSHYRGEEWVGRTPAELDEEFDRRAAPITGRAGDLCLMSTWAVHGGAANRSNRPRRLLIADYTAADAFPLSAPAVPSVFTGRIVRGNPSRVARLSAGTIEMLRPYADDSFFSVQGQAGVGKR